MLRCPSCTCMILCLVALVAPCLSIAAVKNTSSCEFWVDLILVVFACALGGSSFQWAYSTPWANNSTMIHIFSFSPWAVAVLLAIVVLACNPDPPSCCFGSDQHQPAQLDSGQPTQSDAIERRVTRKAKRERRKRRLARRADGDDESSSGTQSGHEGDNSALLELTRSKRSQHAREVKLCVLAEEGRSGS